MAFVPHLKLSVTGTLGSSTTTVEIFSWGLSIAGPTVATDPLPYPTAGTMTAVEAAITTMHGTASMCIASGARIRAYKWASIGADGLYADAPVVHPVNVPGGSGAVPFPPQNTICVSLKHTLSYPPVSGRIYLPAPTAACGINGATFVMDTSERGQISAGITTCLTAVNAALFANPDPLTLVIASQGRTSPVRPPANYTIETVGVGRAVDTQRRRRNDLVEDYLVTTLP